MKRTGLMCMIVFIVVMSGCGEKVHEPDTQSQLPKSWITFQGDKFIYQTSLSKKEMQNVQLRPTGEFTDENDGTKAGLEIFVSKESGALYVMDKTNGARPWLKYTVNTSE